MAWLRSMLGLLALNLRANLTRPRQLLLVAAGLLIAALTLLTVLTMPAGIERIAANTGRDDVAVVLASRMSETQGNIKPGLVRRIGTLPGVTHKPDGTPRIAPQFVVHVRLKRQGQGPGTVIVRGVTPAIWDVVGDSVDIVTGERPEAGLRQLVSGIHAAREYVYASAGSEIRLRRWPWQVTGEFRAGGSLWESELWASRSALQAAYNAQGQTTVVWVRLTSPDAFETFTEAMQRDPRLRGFSVMRQNQFYATQVAYLTTFGHVAAWAIAIILGLMAILASNNALGLSLRSRRRELAMLRAVGFGNAVVYATLLIETLLIAALGAGVAIGLGLLLIDAHGIDSATLHASIHFTTAVTDTVMLTTLGYTLLLGLVSMLVPAWRALHAPLVKSLARE